MVSSGCLISSEYGHSLMPSHLLDLALLFFVDRNNYLRRRVSARGFESHDFQFLPNFRRQNQRVQLFLNI